MPEFVCRIRIRPRHRISGQPAQEWRDVAVVATDSVHAQDIAKTQVGREFPDAFISAHGGEPIGNAGSPVILPPTGMPISQPWGRLKQLVGRG